MNNYLFDHIFNEFLQLEEAKIGKQKGKEERVRAKTKKSKVRNEEWSKRQRRDWRKYEKGWVE